MMWFARLIFFFISVTTFIDGGPAASHVVDCKSRINVAWWSKAPLTQRNDTVMVGIMRDLLDDMLKFCCPANLSVNYTMIKDGAVDLFSLLPNAYKTYDNNTEDEEDEETDLFLPVTGYIADQRSRLHYQFLPLVESPGILHVHGSKPPYSPGYIVLTACVNAWPVLVFLAVLATVSGMMVWAIDSFYNPEQAPDNLWKGVWRGIWWSMVSMTTVGYGDHAPKSLPARLFAGLWLMLGLCIVSMFTANATTTMTSMTLGTTRSIHGKTMYAVQHSEEYRYGVQHGAHMIATESLNEIWHLLETKDGTTALIDTIAASHYSDKYETLKKNMQILDVIDYSFAYGILMRDMWGKWGVSNSSAGRRDGGPKHVGCFVKYPSLREEAIMKLAYRKMKLFPGKKSSMSEDMASMMFSPTGKMFKDFLYSTGSLFTLMLLVGLMWEIQRRRKTGKEYPDKQVDADCAGDEGMVESNMGQLIERQCREIEEAMEFEVERFFARFIMRIEEARVMPPRRRQRVMQKKPLNIPPLDVTDA